MNATAYYESALAALRFIEARLPTSRRFGAEADARWASFRGDLTTADRIDVLLRDADAEWPGAFGARAVFALRAVAEDDPFGSTWVSLDPVDAEALWREVTRRAVDVDVCATLLSVARAWKLETAVVDVGPILAADKLVVVGPSAVVAVAAAFTRGAALDWADQVVVVATPPAHRQLAALAAALLNQKTTVLVDASTAAPPSPSGPAARLIRSADADDDDAARALVLAAGKAAPSGGLRPGTAA